MSNTRDFLLENNNPHYNRMRAKECGETRYFSPKPCPKGHIGERMTSTGMCRLCLKQHKLKPKNVVKELERLRLDRINNPDKYRGKDKRYRSIINNKLNYAIRARVVALLNNRYKSKNFDKIFGYSFDEFKHHIERQFTNGMTWDNYGRNGWHIDHIIPVSYFNYNTIEDDDFKMCWSLSNLRPLWAKDNYKKSSIRTHLL